MFNVPSIALACMLAVTGACFLPTVAESAPPTITGSDKVFAEVGEWAEVKVTTDGKSIRFVPLDDGLLFFPFDKLKDPSTAFVSARVEGRFRILCYTGSADGPSDPFIVTVTFGRPVLPPTPKPPVPPVPVPVDPLVKVFADALAADAAPDGRERVRALAAVMREAATYAKTEATNQDLAAKVSARTREKVAASLPNVRKAIGAHFVSEKFPAEVVTLDANLRTRFEASYTRIALALEEVVK